jgi:hypothetical protein
MALTNDVTISFNAAAGYRCEGGAGGSCPSTNIEFTAGGARIKPATASGSFLLLSPALPVAGFGQIYSAAVTATEAAGYYHKFAVSFNAGVDFQTYDSGGWRKLTTQALLEAPATYAAAVSDIVSEGLGLAELNLIRDWPEGGEIDSSIQLAVVMVKAVGGGNGLIDQWTVAHGTTTFDVTGEPDGADSLVNDGTNPFYTPDYPLKRTIEWASFTRATEMGYRDTKNRGALPRSTYECEWRNRTTTHAGAIETFLTAHQDAAFTWTPPGFPSAKKWVSSEPTITLEDPGIYTVRATLTEVLPA